MRPCSPLGLCLVSLCLACDAAPKPKDGSEDASASPKAEPAAPIAAEPSDAETQPEAEPPKQARPEAAPEAAPAEPEFAAHVAKLLAAAKLEVGDEPGKVAFAHYKAGRHAQAIPLFGAAALARSSEWKPAFNMACSAALHGDEDTARIALREALHRDREAVSAKAKSDADLAALRAKPWFAELLAEPEAPAAPATGEDPEDALDRSWYGQNCSDLDWEPQKRTQRCWDDYLVGAFEFGAPLRFDTPLELDLPEPGAMPKSRWKRVGSKLDIRGITKALGVRGGYGLDPDSCEAPLALIFDVFDCPFYRPGFWWPAEGGPILVLPHTERRSPNTVRTITLARKVGDSWKATTIDAILDPDHLASGSYVLQSGPLLRPDGLEFWTWAQGYDESEGFYEDLYLCRIAWRDGALREACARDWSTQFSFAHPEVTEQIRKP